MNFPIMVEEIHKLQQRNVQYMRIIEENEIHAASLVHELRNPLNSQVKTPFNDRDNELMGTVTLLEKSFGPKTVQTNEIFSMAKSCGEHLHTLIGNLLEYSKLKAKKIEINIYLILFTLNNKSAIDLKNNIKRILKMNYLKSQEKQNKINYFISNNFPKKVVTDEQRINQVLINLVSNALKFTDKGTVSVYLGWRPGFQCVSSQDYSDIVKDIPLNYVEQRNLFKAFIEQEEDVGYHHLNSNESISDQNIGYPGCGGPSYHYNHHRNNHTDFDIQRCQSQFELDNNSNKKLGRSISDNQGKDQISLNNKIFPYSIQDQDSSANIVKPFKSEKIMNVNGYPINPLNTTFTQQQVHQNLNIQDLNDASSELIEEKKSISSNNNKKFIQEVDDFLLNDQDDDFELLVDDIQSIRDEFISGTDLNKISVRGVINLKNILKDSEQDMKVETLSYGTPKQESITEQQRKIIEIVVNNHKKAASEISQFVLPESDSQQFLETLREELISAMGKHPPPPNVYFLQSDRVFNAEQQQLMNMVYASNSF